MASSAFSAPLVPPETGASKKLILYFFNNFDKLIAVLGFAELISMTVDPFFKFFKNSELKYIFFIALSSDNMVIIRSWSLTTSFRELHTFAPNFFSLMALFLVLLKTLTSYFDFRRFLAIGNPIKPIPIKPILTFFII